jgi:hypothetical protein
MSNLIKINALYENLTYFDQFGGSVITCIILVIILILFAMYMNIQANIIPIQDNWTAERCKPQHILFAGIINPQPGMSMSQTTQDNFTYCNQNILSGMFGGFINPLSKIIEGVVKIFASISDAIQNIRMMLSNIRSSVSGITKNILDRTINIMVIFDKIYMGIFDAMAKIQGVLVGSLYTVLGSYFALQTLMGTIIEFITYVIIAIYIVALVLFMIPFTTWIAVPVIASLMVVSAILLTIVIVSVEHLHVGSVLGIPTISMPKKSCFHPNTKIRIQSGEVKYIKDLNLGDSIQSSIITAIIKITSTEPLYMFENSGIDNENIYVSGSHRILHNEKFIFVKDHPHSIAQSEVVSDHYFTLITTEHKIAIGKHIFWDWDD